MNGYDAFRLRQREQNLIARLEDLEAVKRENDAKRDIVAGALEQVRQELFINEIERAVIEPVPVRMEIS